MVGYLKTNSGKKKKRKKEKKNKLNREKSREKKCEREGAIERKPEGVKKQMNCTVGFKDLWGSHEHVYITACI